MQAFAVTLQSSARECLPSMPVLHGNGLFGKDKYPLMAEPPSPIIEKPTFRDLASVSGAFLMQRLIAVRVSLRALPKAMH